MNEILYGLGGLLAGVLAAKLLQDIWTVLSRTVKTAVKKFHLSIREGYMILLFGIAGAVLGVIAHTRLGW